MLSEIFRSKVFIVTLYYISDTKKQVCFALLCFALSCLVSSRLVSSRLVSSRLVSSRFVSFRFVLFFVLVWFGFFWLGWVGFCLISQTQSSCWCLSAHKRLKHCCHLPSFWLGIKKLLLMFIFWTKTFVAFHMTQLQQLEESLAFILYRNKVTKNYINCGI